MEKIIRVKLFNRKYGVYFTGEHWELTPGHGTVFTTEAELNEAMAGIKTRFAAILPDEHYATQELAQYHATH